MLPAFDTSRLELAALCRHFYVRRLDLFGSAARGVDFDLARSDLDLLVEYEPSHAPPALADFLALREALAVLFGRKADLTMESAIRNPYLRAGIAADRMPLHGA